MLRGEDSEMSVIYDWVNVCTDLPFIRIENARKCTPGLGAKLKRLGVRKGVSDIFIPRANKSFHGLFIELKTLTGRPTKEQINFLIQMIDEGYQAMVCYGAEQAIKEIKKFYEL